MLPFSRDEFFEVFGAYNESLWPFALGLWLLTIFALVAILRGARVHRSLLPAVLAVHWCWAGLAYHAAFFSRINPAAWAFSALFVIEGVLLAWRGVLGGRLEFSRGRSVRHAMASALIIYALIYPAVARAEGHTYPQMPTFGVPCPTTILTIGFLLLASPSLPLSIAVIPILWAVIGGSAAFLLGVRADVVLLAAGAILAIDLMMFRHVEPPSRQKTSREGDEGPRHPPATGAENLPPERAFFLRRRRNSGKSHVRPLRPRPTTSARFVLYVRTSDCVRG